MWQRIAMKWALAFLLLTVGCTVEGLGGNQIPLWEASNELRRVQKCENILDLCRLRIDRAVGFEAKQQAYDDCDLNYAMAGCGIIGDGSGKR